MSINDTSTTQEQPKAVSPVKYYPINETAARHANAANIFSDYRPGSATAEYRHMVDKAVEVAERQKKRVDPEHHAKTDYLLDLYARKLAENMNQSYAIESRVPSVLIAGPANFPARKKQKQNAARDKNMQEWRYIQGLLDKIRSTGIRSWLLSLYIFSTIPNASFFRVISRFPCTYCTIFRPLLLVSLRFSSCGANPTLG